MRVFRNGVVALMLLSFTACTTMQPMEDFSPSQIRQQVEVGDEVEIVGTNGITYALQVLEVGDTYLMGRSSTGKRYRIEYEAIKTIRLAEASASKTIGLTGAILAMLGIAALILFIRSLDETMGGSGC